MMNCGFIQHVVYQKRSVFYDGNIAIPDLQSWAGNVCLLYAYKLSIALREKQLSIIFYSQSLMLHLKADYFLDIVRCFSSFFPLCIFLF